MVRGPKRRRSGRVGGVVALSNHSSNVCDASADCAGRCPRVRSIRIWPSSWRLCSRRCVAGENRYRERDLAGLKTQPRSGRRRRINVRSGTQCCGGNDAAARDSNSLEGPPAGQRVRWTPKFRQVATVHPAPKMPAESGPGGRRCQLIDANTILHSRPRWR